MNNLRIIFVNWTKPFFYRDQFTGYRKSSDSGLSSNKYKIPDHEIVMQIAAITSAKKYGRCPIKLFTDDCGYEYYKKINILSLFDEVDVQILNGVNNNPNINPAQFWTSGKIISICNQEPPFIFMDLDLIIKDYIPDWFSNYDLVHTHWEICRGPLYINFSQLKEYGIEMDEFDEKMMIPNTSFLFVNDQKILDKYLKLHLQLVDKKYDQVPDWLWLMSDQNILGYTIRELDSKVSEITNKIFVQYPDGSHNEEKPGYIPDWIEIPGIVKNVPKISYEHVWITKGALIKDHESRNKRVFEWNEIISNNGFNEYVILGYSNIHRRSKSGGIHIG
jgi:hypothetical protein